MVKVAAGAAIIKKSINWGELQSDPVVEQVKLDTAA